MLASFTCAISFYGGRWIDGFLAFLFGFIVYYLDDLCGRVRGLGQIEGFLASTIISFISFCLSKYVLTPLHVQHCPYAQIFGAIVWLLPGVTLSVSLLELYSSMIAYGSSRLLYGIAISAQLGFGLGVGFHAIGGLPDDLLSGCLPVNASPATQLFLMLIASASFSMICNAELKRIPGLLLTALVGYVLAVYTIPGTGSLIIASFGVTIAARLYSYYIRRRYLLYIYGGLLVLVPGSISVRGFIGIWSGDHAAAVQFTLLMLANCICLAIGVFIGLLPRKKWMLWRRRKIRESLSWIWNRIATLWMRLCDCCSTLIPTNTHHFLSEGNDHHSSYVPRQKRSSSIDEIEISVISPEPASRSESKDIDSDHVPEVESKKGNQRHLLTEESLEPQSDIESGRERFSSSDSETLIHKI
jgi:uncharacterized membrane protein YjjB (DUF3815 family)